MKTQTTFENSSLVSVVNGRIAVKDANERIHTFTNASVISVNNGTIIIESEWKPKKGELIKLTGCNTNCYCIYRRCEENYIYDYGFKKIADSTLHTVIDNFSWCIAGVTVSPVTPEEQKEFDDFCKSQGKIWNRETLQWEKYRWNPKSGEEYWYISYTGLVHNTIYNTTTDIIMVEFGNCFQTKEQAEKATEKVKELLKSL